MTRVWKEYGGMDSDRYRLMRTRYNRARWFDVVDHVWVGPEQSNVAPAIAWALTWHAPRALYLQERVGGYGA